MSSWARKPAFEPDHSFSTDFLLLSSISIYFWPFLLTLYRFYSFLIVFNCFKPNPSVYLKTYFYLFLCYFSIIFIHFCYIWQNSFTSLAMFSNRVGPGQVKSDKLALDPMRAGPGHEKSGLTLALLGSGRVGPRANRAWPCPRTV